MLVVLVGCAGGAGAPDVALAPMAPLGVAGLPLGADVSGLSPDQQAAFWRGVAWLNAQAGVVVFAPDATSTHVAVLGACDPLDATGWYDDGQVCLDWAWLLAGGQWTADQLIAHELLHSLGVDHDDGDPDSVMSPNLSVRSVTLRPAALAAIHAFAD